jgi:hypothetical protein
MEADLLPLHGLRTSLSERSGNMTAKTWITALVAAYVLATSTGCAVYLAHKGQPGAHLEALGVGTSEQEVEHELGTPSGSEPLGAGKRLSTYRVELTKQPNYARSTVHLLLDLATLGIWELPGSIYELGSGHRKGDVGIVYGPDNRVLEVRDPQALHAQTVSANEFQTETSSWQGLWYAISK